MMETAVELEAFASRILDLAAAVMRGDNPDLAAAIFKMGSDDVRLLHRAAYMLKAHAPPPPKCGACNDVDSVNCAVCGIIG